MMPFGYTYDDVRWSRQKDLKELVSIVRTETPRKLINNAYWLTQKGVAYRFVYRKYPANERSQRN